MRFTDALTLSWTNVRQYKRRSFAIVLTISLLFALVLGFNFILQGLETTLESAATAANSGQIYVNINYAGLFEGDGQSEALTTTTQTEISKQVQTELAKYHGTLAGETRTPGVGGGWRTIIDEDLAQEISDFNLAGIAESAVPYLSPIDEDEDATAYRTVSGIEQDSWLTEVGNYSSTQTGSPTLNGFNPLNLLLGRVYGANFDHLLVIDDGSGRIGDYLAYLSSIDINPQPDSFGFIATFNDYEQAADFVSHTSLPGYIAIDGARYGLDIYGIFSNALDLREQIASLERLLVAVQIIFIVVAIIVAVLTFSHLIDQDAATVALYRSLGASTRQIYLIYFLYLLELCLLAVLATLVLALLMVGALYLSSSGALAARLQEFYHLAAAPSVNLFGWNPICLVVLGMIVIIAPVAMLCSLGHFQPKNIAKKLKEE